ncbi:MAG: histidinol dehydrogenase [Chromatiales bacterium]|nr:histidinol dehydrogenase [Chromatiales bacterium]
MSDALSICRLSSLDCDFEQRLAALFGWSEETDRGVEERVRQILDTVKLEGDAAVIRYTNQFDRRQVTSASALELDRGSLEAAFQSISDIQRDALGVAAERIRAFHEHQRESSWQFEDAHGNILGQQVSALERVGIYVPGGKAAYPSSVLMNALPAKVAGVDEVIMMVPAPDEKIDPMVLAAARVAGVDRVFTIGGAQAIAALAFGTETVPAVDKIVGPGNIYVATAKRMVFGICGIDMVAGPSEVLIISDGSVNPDWLAMDMFAQAEHDEDARAVLISHDLQHLDAVEEALVRLLPRQDRKAIIGAALAARGGLIQVADVDEAVMLANRMAPEHLELALNAPDAIAPKIRNAGAIFLGAYSAEAFGDYCAGPNHVLPTARTARFSSPLGVYDFQKRTSLIHCSQSGVRELAPVVAILARGEGLGAHAQSALLRPGRNDG